jgi:hypothetical protein
VGLKGVGEVRRVCVWGWRDFSLFVILLGWWILPWCFGGVMGGFCAF